MENDIYQILKKHKLPLKKREEVLNDLLLLLSVSQQRELLEAYQHFIDWNEEHDRKASTSERIDAFITSNCD